MNHVTINDLTSTRVQTHLEQNLLTKSVARHHFNYILNGIEQHYF